MRQPQPKKNLYNKLRKDFPESDEHKEILEIWNKVSSDVILSCCCKTLIGDLSINCLEYFENNEVSKFYISLSEYGAIASIYKPTQAAKNSHQTFSMSL